MEVYLNSIEMGKGIYGAEAAAQYKFNTKAAKLSNRDNALIAATLPNPIRFNSANLSSYILRRQQQYYVSYVCCLLFLRSEKYYACKPNKKGNDFDSLPFFLFYQMILSSYEARSVLSM